jgi:hypothetical protein
MVIGGPLGAAPGQKQKPPALAAGGDDGEL